MIVAWLVYALAMSVLLLAAAHTGDFIVRAFGGPTRVVWAGAMCGSIALSTVALLRPSGRDASQATSLNASQPRSIVASRTSTPQHELELALANRSLRLIDIPRPFAQSWVARVDSARLDRLNRSIAGVALISTLIAFTYLIAVYRRLRRLERSLTPETLDGSSVLMSDDIGPAVFGIFRTSVVLPHWIIHLPSRDRRAILDHEQQHVEALDPALLFAGAVLLCLQPWNVALWVMLSRLRLAIELDCDRRVLLRGADVHVYTRLLLAVYERASLTLSPRIQLVERASYLELRVKRMFARSPRLISARGGAATTLTVALVTVACETPSPSRPAVTFTASVVRQMPRCLRSDVEMEPRFQEVRAIARERHPGALGSGASERMMVGLVFDEHCNLQRDTVVRFEGETANPARVLRAVFPDLFEQPQSPGIIFAAMQATARPRPTIVYGVVPSAEWAAQSARSACGFGVRESELCYLNGPLVIRMVDSVRAIIAARRFDRPNASADQLFLVTMLRPDRAVASRVMAHGHLEYQRGDLYVEDMATTEPPVLFVASASSALSQRHPKLDVRRIDELVAVAHYESTSITLEQLQRPSPPSRCRGISNACYMVGETRIEFPD